MAKKKKQLTRAEKVAAFIHRYCKVPDGMYVGQPLILEDFQLKFIKDVYDNPAGTKKAILSMAKKNAKTALIACLILCHLVGPEARQNSQMNSAAMSKDQATIIYDTCVKMIRLDRDLSQLIRIKESLRILVGLPMNVEFEALSAEAKTKHGLSPRVSVIDELGQVIGPYSELYDALDTAQGAHDDPIMFIISTQAASDADLLSIIIDDALESKDPRIVCHLYTAPEDCEINDEKAWAAANPALGLFRSRQDVADLAAQAARMPSKEAKFRNLILNQRIATASPFISKDSWKACAGGMIPLSECIEITAGLDLSSRFDLAALVIRGFHEESNTYPIYPYFWTPEVGLEERVKRDRAPYDLWVKQGFLKTTPGVSVDYEFMAAEVAEILAAHEMTALAFDRWRIEFFKKELTRIGFDMEMTPFGQGFKDMSPALDGLEEKILNQQLRHDNHPVMTMCMANARVSRDAADNRKLDKMKATGRIDGAVALAMADGAGSKIHAEPADFTEFLSNPLVFP